MTREIDSFKVYPDVRKRVYFEFPTEKTLKLVSSDIEVLRQDNTAMDVGIADLKGLAACLLEFCGCDNVVPAEYVTWFWRRNLFTTKRLFIAVFCPTCERTYLNREITRKVWRHPGRGPRGGGKGKARREYYVCPKRDELFTIMFRKA